MKNIIFIALCLFCFSCSYKGYQYSRGKIDDDWFTLKNVHSDTNLAGLSFAKRDTCKGELFDKYFYHFIDENNFEIRFSSYDQLACRLDSDDYVHVIKGKYSVRDNELLLETISITGMIFKNVLTVCVLESDKIIVQELFILRKGTKTKQENHPEYVLFKVDY